MNSVINIKYTHSSEVENKTVVKPTDLYLCIYRIKTRWPHKIKSHAA